MSDLHSMSSSRADTEQRCCNCGARRDDLIEHEGDLWCPNYGDCDRTFYYQQIARDLEEDGQL